MLYGMYFSARIAEDMLISPNMFHKKKKKDEDKKICSEH